MREDRDKEEQVTVLRMLFKIKYALLADFMAKSLKEVQAFRGGKVRRLDGIFPKEVYCCYAFFSNFSNIKPYNILEVRT